MTHAKILCFRLHIRLFINMTQILFLHRLLFLHGLLLSVYRLVEYIILNKILSVPQPTLSPHHF